MFSNLPTKPIKPMFLEHLHVMVYTICWKIESTCTIKIKNT